MQFLLYLQVEALGEIEIATSLIKDDIYTQVLISDCLLTFIVKLCCLLLFSSYLIFCSDLIFKEDPLYSKYHCLRCELVPLDVVSKEFSMVINSVNINL